jgi:hypothetical protein
MSDTYFYPVKCMACGLHWGAYSWSDTWIKDHNQFCPECGSQDRLMFWYPRKVGKEIFEIVPGTSSGPMVVA